MCDTYGRRKIIVVGNYLTAFAWVFIALSTSWQTYFMTQILLSLACFWTVAEHTILADSMIAEKRGLGFSVFWTMIQLTGLASPYIGGWILENYQLDGMRIVLFSIAVADGVKAMFYTKSLKETLMPPKKKESLNLRSVINPFIETFKTLKWMPKSLLGFCAIESIYGFAWSLVGPFFVLYSFDVISLTPMEWGLISVIELGVGLCFRIPGGRLADRYEKRWLLLVLLLIEVPGFIGFIYSRSYSHVLFLFIVWTAIAALTEPAWDALETDLTPREQRGKVSSLIGIFVAFFGFFGSIAGGYLYSLVPALPFWAYLPFALLGIVVTYRFIHEPEKPEK